jgi:hypothetical protein
MSDTDHKENKHEEITGEEIIGEEITGEEITGEEFFTDNKVSDVDEDDEYQSQARAKELAKLIDEVGLGAGSGIFDKLKFATKFDKEVFDRLPMSDICKANIIKDLYSVPVDTQRN